MQVNDIVEILSTDGNGSKGVRRVRVKSLIVVGRCCQIVGENLYGKYPKAYLLPKTSHNGPVPTGPDWVGWQPFEGGEADE